MDDKLEAGEMRWYDWLNPNKLIPDDNPIWYWIALALSFLTIILSCCLWGDDFKVVDGKEHDLQILMPKLVGSLMTIIFVSGLFVRGCLKMPRNIWTLLLFVTDLFILASFLELIFTGSTVTLFSIKPKWLEWIGFEGVSFGMSPRALAIGVILLTWVGARAIAGVGVILLCAVTMIRLATVEESLGMRGVFIVFSGFLSLALQMKLPGMRIDKKRSKELLEDMGRGASRLATEAQENLQATGQAATAGVKMAAKAAAAYATGGASLVADAATGPATVPQVSDSGGKD